MQCHRAVPSIGHLGCSPDFYYKLFPDVYDLSIWRIALRTSSTRQSWAKIMNYLGERKCHRQTLCLKYIFGKEVRNPKETSADLSQKSSHTLSLASLAAEVVLPYFFPFTTFSNRPISSFLTIVPPAASVFFRVCWGWPLWDQVLAGVTKLQHVHDFAWSGDARRVWPPSGSFPHTLLKPRQRFSAMTELSGWASAQTAPLLTPEHGGWVSVNIIQQHTLPAAWCARWGGCTLPCDYLCTLCGAKSNCPLSYGWVCTQHVVETMKGLAMSDLNSVHAMEGALSTCPSSVSLKGSVGLTCSRSASSQL